ncbi:DMT family transporter [Pseudomonas viridiflava]
MTLTPEPVPGSSGARLVPSQRPPLNKPHSYRPSELRIGQCAPGWVTLKKRGTCLMNVVTAFALSLATGFAVPLQAGTHARLGGALGHPLLATTVSLIVSLIAVIGVMLIFKVQRPGLMALQGTPWWVWLGGIAGAFYITTALLMAPKSVLNRTCACVCARLSRRGLDETPPVRPVRVATYGQGLR